MGSKVKTTRLVPLTETKDMDPKHEQSILSAAASVAPGGGGGQGVVTIDKEEYRRGGSTSVRVDYPNGAFIQAANSSESLDDKRPTSTISTGVRGSDGKDIFQTEITNASGDRSWHKDTVTGKEADSNLIRAGTEMLLAAGERVTPEATQTNNFQPK